MPCEVGFVLGCSCPPFLALGVLLFSLDPIVSTSDDTAGSDVDRIVNDLASFGIACAGAAAFGGVVLGRVLVRVKLRRGGKKIFLVFWH